MFDAAQYEFLSFPGLLKARPATEGEDRFVYFEASNESRDLQGEVVMCKALADSADYYLKFGNVDVDHVTQIGAKAGIPGYSGFEIGAPRRSRSKATHVRQSADLHGSGQMAKMANEVWESLTSVEPAGALVSVGGWRRLGEGQSSIPRRRPCTRGAQGSLDQCWTVPHSGEPHRGDGRHRAARRLGEVLGCVWARDRFAEVARHGRLRHRFEHADRRRCAGARSRWIARFSPTGTSAIACRTTSA